MIVRDKMFGNFEFCSTPSFYSRRYISLTKTFHLQQAENTWLHRGARCSPSWRASTRRSPRRWGWSTVSRRRAWSPCRTSWPATLVGTTRRVSWTTGEEVDGWVNSRLGPETENNYLYHFRERSFTVIKDVVRSMIARRTMKMSLHSRREISLWSWPRRLRTTTGWRASWSLPPTSEACSPPPLSTCWLNDHRHCLETQSSGCDPGLRKWWKFGALPPLHHTSGPAWWDLLTTIAQLPHTTGREGGGVLTLWSGTTDCRVNTCHTDLQSDQAMIWSNVLKVKTARCQYKCTDQIFKLALNFNCD